MHIGLFDYELPPELIAQEPLPERDASRLLVLDRVTGAVRHQAFRDLPDLLDPGDLLVVNRSRVFPARLLGRRTGGGAAEVLLVRAHLGDGTLWDALVRPGRRLRAGDEIAIAEDLTVRIEPRKGTGREQGPLRTVRVLARDGDVAATLERHGHVPLPPYIRRPDAPADRDRYQTVYAREVGSVAAPTAGIVGDVPVHVGDRVTTSTVVTTIDQKTGLEAYISIPIERAPQVRLGTPVAIVDSDGQVVAESKVTFVSPQVDTATQSVLVKAAIENPKAVLRSSQFVRARVIWKSAPGLLVPVTAVSRVSGQYFVYVAEGQGNGAVARQRPVRLGSIVGNDYVVLDGIKPGDRLIVSGTQSLADGATVAVEN